MVEGEGKLRAGVWGRRWEWELVQGRRQEWMGREIRGGEEGLGRCWELLFIKWNKMRFLVKNGERDQGKKEKEKKKLREKLDGGN